jgi:hypothetical protein
MAKSKYKEENKLILDSFLLETQGVVPGKMFGYPAYYTNKKLFACIYEDGVAVKIPENKVNELIGKKGISHFQPMGRSKMREWILINREKPGEYLKDKEIFNDSIKFVLTMSSKKK